MDRFGSSWQGHWDRIRADWRSRVTEDDVVLIAGDISWAMHLKDARDDLNAIGELPGTKILTRGNHDFWWSSVTKVRAALPKSMFVLQNDALRVGNFVFAGTRGWMESGAEEDINIFARETIRLDLTLSAAKRLMDEHSRLIVMLHYPPVLAHTHFSSFCPLLEEAGASLCVYGHLHGVPALEAEPTVQNGVTYLLTSCDMLGFSLRELTPFI
ncbi:MAG: metallophosphoesterase, partial [Clostridia bacterium]|nr:metallophosphoesterase [Clostridia bacterium]